MSLDKEIIERSQFYMDGHIEDMSRFMRWYLKLPDSKGGKNSTIDFDYVRASEISQKF